MADGFQAGGRRERSAESGTRRGIIIARQPEHSTRLSAPPASLSDFSVEELDYGFLPFLHATWRVFAVFACRPVRLAATGDILTGYDVLPSATDVDRVAALDGMVLKRAHQGLVDMALRRRAAFVVVPVAYGTLANPGSAAAYLALLQKMAPSLRSHLVLGLSGCPDDVPGEELAATVDPLKRLGLAVSVRLPSASRPLAAIEALGAFSVEIDLRHYARTELAQPCTLRRFAAEARKRGLYSFVDSIDTPGLATWCRAAGVDYLGGRVFAEMSDHVGPVAGPSLA